MLDYQPLHQRDHLCSSTPTLKMHVRRKSTGDKDHDVWDGPHESMFYDSFSFDTDLEFQSASIGVLSPPLWKSHCSRSIHVESRPLLPHNHVYSSISLSPVSRRRAIADGRRELMEMVENLPELTYELSLKDIVDARNCLEDKGEKEERSDSKADIQITTPKKKKKNSNGNLKRGPITRTPSMESETFLIKMFFPASLGSKKKAKPGNSGRLLSLESSNQNEKVWWSRKSTSDTTRYGKEREFIPGCWSFFYSKKNKSIRDERCLC